MAEDDSTLAASRTRHDCVLVGVDSTGNWIVRDFLGRHGGLFVSRSAALHYARLEFGHRSLPIIMTSENLEIDTSSAN